MSAIEISSKIPGLVNHYVNKSFPKYTLEERVQIENYFFAKISVIKDAIYSAANDEMERTDGLVENVNYSTTLNNAIQIKLDYFIFQGNRHDIYAAAKYNEFENKIVYYCAYNLWDECFCTPLGISHI